MAHLLWTCLDLLVEVCFRMDPMTRCIFQATYRLGRWAVVDHWDRQWLHTMPLTMRRIVRLMENKRYFADDPENVMMHAVQTNSVPLLEWIWTRLDARKRDSVKSNIGTLYRAAIVSGFDDVVDWLETKTLNLESHQVGRKINAICHACGVAGRPDLMRRLTSIEELEGSFFYGSYVDGALSVGNCVPLTAQWIRSHSTSLFMNAIALANLEMLRVVCFSPDFEFPLFSQMQTLLWKSRDPASIATWLETDPVGMAAWSSPVFPLRPWFCAEIRHTDAWARSNVSVFDIMRTYLYVRNGDVASLEIMRPRLPKDDKILFSRIALWECLREDSLDASLRGLNWLRCYEMGLFFSETCEDDSTDIYTLILEWLGEGIDRAHIVLNRMPLTEASVRWYLKEYCFDGGSSFNDLLDRLLRYGRWDLLVMVFEQMKPMLCTRRSISDAYTAVDALYAAWMAK